jgi:peptidoglycan hydrolase-like protein with peptidoglycan-binding domain
VPHVVKWRSRAALIVAVLVCALTAGAATAAAAQVLKVGSRGPAVSALQEELGIPSDGIFGKQTKRAVKRFQRSEGLEVDGIAGPATLSALGLADAARSSKGTSVSSILESIAQCESGGDPTAVSPSGQYRGKYQFSRETWKSLGGKGDPAKASERRQDRLAAKLYARAGTSPWPNCA